MSSYPVPWHVAATELNGNGITIPRDIQLATCYPSMDTAYYLPKLSLEPSPDSYMSWRVLMLRTYTAFQITLTAAAGDTIMGQPSIVMPGGNLVILVYISGSDWQIMANIPGGTITVATAHKMAEHAKVPDVKMPVVTPSLVNMDPRPMTRVRILAKRR